MVITLAGLVAVSGIPHPEHRRDGERVALDDRVAGLRLRRFFALRGVAEDARDDCYALTW